ncbi:MAG: NAD(P)-dependent oxidoreductase [Pseudomonadota bacterium]
MNPQERIGFIGLGEIGEPMAARVADAGYAMRVYNRTASKAAPFAARGIEVAASAADVARGSDIIFLCITNADAIEQLVFGPEGIAAGARPGQLVVDLSTIHPYATRALAARLKQAGVQWVDAPVSGGPGGARAGTLAVMAGGEAADIERARPVIMSFAGKVTHMGPVGCGVAMKACNQMLSFCTASVLAETLNLANNFGIDPNLIQEAVAGGFADSNVVKHLAKPLIDGTYSGDGVMGLKDLGIALELGRQTGSAMPMTSLMASMWQLVIAQGFTRGGLGTTMRLYSQGPLVARKEKS